MPKREVGKARAIAKKGWRCWDYELPSTAPRHHSGIMGGLLRNPHLRSKISGSITLRYAFRKH
jgi:hypothetical protein